MPSGPPKRPESRSEVALVRLLRRLLEKADGRYLLLYTRKP
jgi:hypothetical protein